MFNLPLQLVVIFLTQLQTLFTLSLMLFLIESYISLKILIENDSLN